VYYFISINNLPDELLYLLVVHLPNLVEANLIAFFKPLEFFLQLLKLARKFLVVLCQFDVFLFKFLALIFKAFLSF
jgi:hypothetical protein